jgi:DNA-3-methyladenine glycosylase
MATVINGIVSVILSFGDRPSAVISPTWFARPSPQVAIDMVGCVLVRQFENGQVCRSIIVETEAYAPDDPACHAYRRRTPRNAVMFGPAGFTYVYLIYGIYHCLNVVTDVDGLPSAVLIRAAQLQDWPGGIIPEKAASHPQKALGRAGAGPGKLCRVLGIDRSHSSQLLEPGQPLWLEHRPLSVQAGIQQGTIALHQTTRIGLTQGADIPWRWYIKDAIAVSKR